MTSSRRLPTGLLVLVAAVVVGAGGLWWTRAAPAADRPAAPAAPDADVRIMQLRNGAVLSDGGSRTAAFTGSSQQLASLSRLISEQWPCRIGRPGSRRFDLLRDGLTTGSVADTRVLRLPTCGATSVPRR